MLSYPLQAAFNDKKYILIIICALWQKIEATDAILQM